jgi:ferredoxin
MYFFAPITERGVTRNYSSIGSVQADPHRQTGWLDMAKRVVIDSEECVGCQTCVELCPDVFAFNDASEKAEVTQEEGGPEDCIEEAMSSCPVECIKWEED